MGHAQNAHGFAQARKARGGGSKPKGIWLTKEAKVKGTSTEPVAAIGFTARVLTMAVLVQQEAQALHFPSVALLTFVKVS